MLVFRGAGRGRRYLSFCALPTFMLRHVPARLLIAHETGFLFLDVGTGQIRQQPLVEGPSVFDRLLRCRSSGLNPKFIEW